MACQDFAGPRTWDSDPVLEPVTQQFVESLIGSKPVHTLMPIEARAVLSRLQSVPVGKPSAVIQEMTFPVGPTGSVGIRLVRPRDEPQALPVIMHFHGGGWVLGNADTHDRMTREIAAGVPAAVVFVDYDRAPETQYPVAIEQAYAATKYVVD